MLLAAPHGQGWRRGDRRIVIAATCSSRSGRSRSRSSSTRRRSATNCPTNPLMINDNETVFDIWNTVISLIGLVLIVARAAQPRPALAPGHAPERRLYAPVYAAGVALMIAVIAPARAADERLGGHALDIVFIVSVVPLALVPYLFVAAFVRTRMAQGGAVSELMTRLSRGPAPGGLRDALADALDDPSLELVYWLPEGQRYVDFRGRRLRAARRTTRGGRSTRRRATASAWPRSSTTRRCAAERARARGRRRRLARAPERAPRGRAARQGRRAARLARAHAEDRPRGAPPARARPARRRPAAARSRWR